MALAKERSAQDSHMNLLYYGTVQESQNNSSLVGLLGFENYHKMMVDGGGSERLPPLSDPNENGIMFGDLINSQPEDAQIVIDFKTAGCNNVVHHSFGPLLSFEQGGDVTRNSCGSKVRHDEDNSVWRNHVMDQSYPWNQVSSNRRNESRPSEDLNCFETASSSNYPTVKDNQLVDEGMGWFYSDGGATEGFEDQSTCSETNSHNKRPHMGSEMQCRKKHVADGSRKNKLKIIPSKDPQSIAAKNRRERISERLKILQDLVPNGSKVDLVTMLEKAISYVKFLQLQVKVLATDEFWPAQGGKAPEVSQVKEAIDAILSSHHKDRTSGSS
ncbi:hypothetical protein AQUCO_04100164v1 [Aquilegia coerulea]|uniref:BHLH domain-containing protein n=1 Tax=Aquilegia coerulea TaxID=218851 RepID=A0A2G5CQG1_AQUCA|nr:hypothetical protein AQUCO_04100164v1 [Aquilegia coerulea]